MIIYDTGARGEECLRIAEEVSDSVGFRLIYPDYDRECYSDSGHLLNGRWWPREISEKHAEEIRNIEGQIRPTQTHGEDPGIRTGKALQDDPGKPGAPPRRGQGIRPQEEAVRRDVSTGIQYPRRDGRGG